jgi:hypothetical protein
MRTLDAASTYLDLVWPFLITTAGIGLCITPTTSAIMNAVPDEKQGVASAVNDTTREVGAAIGIAVAGSVLAAQYNNELAAILAGSPKQVGAQALDSLAHALAVAEQMGPQGARLAESAFIQSMDLSLLLVPAGLALAAVFVAVWAPGPRRSTARLRATAFVTIASLR